MHLFLIHYQYLTYSDAIIGIEFYVGLPRELNYRMARYITDGNDLSGFRSFLRGMMDPNMRELQWKTIMGKGKLPEVFENALSLVDVS